MERLMGSMVYFIIWLLVKVVCRRNIVMSNMIELMIWLMMLLASIGFEPEQNFEEPPNEEAMRFYQELEEASRPLWVGSQHSKLSVAVRMINIKSNWTVAEAAMDSMIKLVGKLVSPEFDIPKSYYEAKILVSKLGLSYDRIHYCPNGCMLFYKQDADLNECKLCGHARYKRTLSGKMVPIKAMHYLPIIPRLKRLFTSPSSAPHMRWHSENRRPPGVVTYDVSTKSNFNMRASLMWTINDFPAYRMLSGWMTAGKLACPYCMENSKAFTLKHGHKNSWRRNLGRVCHLPKVTEVALYRLPGYGVEHNWTKQSIFWELPYWKYNLLRHNLDMMHIEKNYFDNLFNTVSDVKGKTKDNPKARLDLKEYCRRPELNLQELANNKVQKIG
ncbi:uncharacterized protein LOC132066357 [Lycium ferocissimum]|uniref:uncharacterized protein LOC132066357 n=1 Tax=Lycium ferocissimum TaxID=112874 RepID=UPI0028158544|nr:uncharacterized protein LOC132066357 [Lycium ferocissimum]